MLITIIIILVVSFVIEVVYRPRLDWDKDTGDIWLWVNGRKGCKRESTKIF